MSFPNGALKEMDGEEFVGTTVSCLMELAGQGIPKDSDELRQRIHSYFRFCEERQMRPSIENLCLSLGTSRQNFWNWCSGVNTKSRDAEWQSLCCTAKQIVLCFLETAHMAGKINPASAIFLLKNWGGYMDSVTVETGTTEGNHAITASELPKLPEV